MAVGTLRAIAAILKAHEGDLLRPPSEAGTAAQVEETLVEMDRLGREKWARILEIARDMKAADEK